jgi:fumarate reductase subunit C
MNGAWTARLLLAQRATAAVLAIAVAIHLATIIYAVRAGLNAGEILGRTRGNAPFLAFYSVFVFAAAIHAPIGLRNVFREWANWRGRSLDIAMILFCLLLLALGFRATFAVYAG